MKRTDELKSLLEPNMVVRLRNGKLYQVVNADSKELIFVSENGGWSDSAISRQNLTSYDNMFDVIEIYGLPKLYKDALKVKTEDRDLIWKEEKDEVELTLSEIATKFSVPVEQLRIKE